MIDEIRALLLFEYRRYMRARQFWRQLLRNVGISLALALALYWLGAVSGDTVALILFLAALLTLGWLMVIQVLPLSAALFDDAYEGRALPDIWLTGMTPLSLALGRWLFAGLYTLFTILAVAPALWLSARAVGVNFGMLLTTLLVFWLSLMRMLPELFIVKVHRRRMQLLSLQQSSGAVGSGTSGILIAVHSSLLYFIFVLTWMDAPPSMPVFLFAPPMALIEAHRTLVVGGLTVPMAVFAAVLLSGFALLGLLALLREADACILWARFWQPLLGSVLFLAVWGLSLYAFADATVQTAAQARTVALGSLWIGWTFYGYFLNELAFFALWRGETLSSAAHPSRRGIFWWTGLWTAMAILAPLIIYAAVGIAIEPMRLGAWLLALSGLCAWMGSLCYRAYPLRNDALTRASFPTTHHFTVGSFIGLIGLTFSAHALSFLIPFPWLRQIVQQSLYLSPVYWAFLPDAPLWVYGLYALYGFVLAGVIQYWRRFLTLRIGG
ncbi:MAG: hypothetical protein NZ874_03575 [Fimbriimonadales bacterium]|nr:hypothetical protein [Fimbriimonadales bacterium]